MQALIMGRGRTRRMAVAEALALGLGWEHVHVVDELRGAGTQLERLRTRIEGVKARHGKVAYSAPPLSADDCRVLRRLGVELVRLKEPDEVIEPIADILTIDADMAPSVLVATIRAVLRI